VIRRHGERHRFRRVGWLRAAVLGADDGIVSTASIMIGVAASSASRSTIIVAGLAALVGGALSMAAGEYVSVSSQRDTELADIARERRELARSPEMELEELTDIYIQRGVEEDLARRVAKQLTAADPLGAHLRDELGMHHAVLARPWQATIVSALSFGAGASFPLLAAVAVPGRWAAGSRIAVIAGVALVLLAVTGAIGSRLGGASIARGAARLLVGGGLAMAVTALIGDLVGSAV
jgi:VIT1/CCC1 family predicted Fe2+/Mn2+ transporter